MSKLGIVTGLKSEARLALAAALRAGVAGCDIDVICAGPGLARARAAAQKLIANGAQMLLSFGIAGALSPAVTPGTVLVPRSVLRQGAPPLPTDDVRTQMVFLGLAATGSLERGPLLSVGDVIVSGAHKSALAAESGAVAVDMESYGVGEAAQAAGRPFAVLRAVADGATHTIPSAALAGVTDDGDVKPARVLKALMGSPRDAVALIELGRANAKAMASLGRAAGLALPLFLVGR